MAPSRRQADIWTNDGIVYLRIYASLGLNELKTIFQETGIFYSPTLLVHSETFNYITHWGLVRHTYVCKLDHYTIASDNGVSPIRRQAILLTNADLLLIEHFGKFQWNFDQNAISFIQENESEYIGCKIAAIWRVPNMTFVCAPCAVYHLLFSYWKLAWIFRKAWQGDSDCVLQLY